MGKVWKPLFEKVHLFGIIKVIKKTSEDFLNFQKWMLTRNKTFTFPIFLLWPHQSQKMSIWQKKEWTRFQFTIIEKDMSGGTHVQKQ